jgi:hypothetical protein
MAKMPPIMGRVSLTKWPVIEPVVREGGFFFKAERSLRAMAHFCYQPNVTGATDRQDRSTK